jgi:L-asparaginase
VTLRKSPKLPAVVIHAGAGRRLGSHVKEERARESLRRIVEETFERLHHHSAEDCVVWAVSELENDPQFNAGTGGKLQIDGVVRLSASLMNGATGRFSGVVNIEQVRNPIQVAQRLQAERDRVLAAGGSQSYARTHGFQVYNPVTEETWAEWKRKSEQPHPVEGMFGTVGAVAVDTSGRLAAATSTGGKGMEIVGRVSDSATCAGNYASLRAAVSATGVGEEIVEAGLAVRIVTRVDDGSPLARAVAKSYRELRARKGRAGTIAVDVRGNVSVEASTECILHAIRTPRGLKSYP